MTFQVHGFTPGITRTPYPQNQSITQRERELNIPRPSLHLRTPTYSNNSTLYLTVGGVTENVFYLCIVYKEPSNYVMWVMVDALPSGAAMKSFQ